MATTADDGLRGGLGTLEPTDDGNLSLGRGSGCSWCWPRSAAPSSSRPVGSAATTRPSPRCHATPTAGDRRREARRCHARRRRPACRPSRRPRTSLVTSARRRPPADRARARAPSMDGLEVRIYRNTKLLTTQPVHRHRPDQGQGCATATRQQPSDRGARQRRRRRTLAPKASPSRSMTRLPRITVQSPKTGRPSTRTGSPSTAAPSPGLTVTARNSNVGQHGHHDRGSPRVLSGSTCDWRPGRNTHHGARPGRRRQPGG